MSAHQAMFPIRTMARVLGVSASGYYAWRGRPASARATADADLTRKLRTIHAASRGIYGAPRIHAELKAEGVPVSRKRVARLMRGRLWPVSADAEASRRHGAIHTIIRRAISSAGISSRPGRTSSGSPTSPSSRPWRVSCSWERRFHGVPLHCQSDVPEPGRYCRREGRRVRVLRHFGRAGVLILLNAVEAATSDGASDAR